MKAFRVWLKRSGDDCRLRIEGLDNAHWLLKRLSESFVFKASDPILAVAEFFTCRLAHSSHLSGAGVERILSNIPAVQLHREPAESAR